MLPLYHTPTLFQRVGRAQERAYSYVYAHAEAHLNLIWKRWQMTQIWNNYGHFSQDARIRVYFCSFNGVAWNGSECTRIMNQGEQTKAPQAPRTYHIGGS